MTKKTTRIHQRINRSVLARQVSELLFCAIIALFLSMMICEFFELEHIISSLQYKPTVNLLAVSSSELKSSYQVFKNANSGFMTLSLFLVIAIALVCVYTLIHLRLFSSESTKVKKKASKYKSYFTSVVASPDPGLQGLYASDVHSDERVHLDMQDLYDVNNREILLKELKGMHGLISGVERQRLNDLYYALGFVDELDRRLISMDWVERAEAVNEVAQFKVSKYYNKIEKLIRDGNQSVQQAAVLATLKVSRAPWQFLELIDRPLNLWEKHQVNLAFQSVDAHRLPSFKSLLGRYPIHHDFLSEMKMKLDV